MAFAFRELHVPLMLIAALIGYQIAIFFFQQYRKSKHEQFHLNKIFLGFGLFFSCLLAGFVLRVIYNYYTSDPLLVDTLSMLAIVVIMVSTIGFMAAVCDPSFAAIVKPRITIIMILINLVPVVAIFLVPYESDMYQLLLLTYTACLLYMLVFQLRLIKKATGIVKTRLITILMGEIMLGVSIAFGSEQIAVAFGGYNAITEIVWLVAIIGAIVGLTTVFLGIFKFPAFLELDWQDGLVQLLIIDDTRSKLIYSYTFNDSDALPFPVATDVQKIDDRGDPQSARAEFASHGLAGIDDVIQEISKADGKKIEKIAHGKLTILFKHQDEGIMPITYALLVNREMRSFEHFLSDVKTQFEWSYKGIINNMHVIKGDYNKIFKNFDTIVKNLLR
ncbi:MAG: hypothetical protein Q6373_003155 [Candidatus Sigynarchaeota archaeon]